MTQYIKITKEAHLLIPKQSIEKMQLKTGMQFKLLADENDVLVLRLVREEESNTQIDVNSLILQQQSLKNIWDSKEEDIYEL